MPEPSTASFRSAGLAAEAKRVWRSIAGCAGVVTALWLWATYPIDRVSRDQIVGLTGITSILVAAMMTYVLVAIERAASAKQGHAGARVAQAVFGADLIVLVLWLVPPWRAEAAVASTTSWLLVVSWVLGGLSLMIGTVALFAYLPPSSSVKVIDAKTEHAAQQASGSAVTAAAVGSHEVVACSGGGIRAAAFVLGGMNAIQERATRDESKPEPALVGVSGGSYLAAAMALVRGWSGHESDGTPTVGWKDAYSLRSPELRRLRRHTRDLVEPRGEVISAFFQWLLGALVNLSVLLGGVVLLGWLLEWVTTRAGTLTYAEGRLTWEVPGVILIALGVIATAIVVATMTVWVAQTRRDAPRTATEPAESKSKWSSRKLPLRKWMPKTRPTRPATATPLAERVRASLGMLLLLALFVFVAVPGAVKGLSALAANNQPTPAIARVLHLVGFTTDEQCQQAAGESVLAAARAAQTDARLSLGEKRSFEAGACGFVTTVTLSADLQSCIWGSFPLCPRTDAEWIRLGTDTLKAAGEVKRTGVAQWALLGAVLTSVIGLIRGGMVSPTDGENRIVTRLKRTAFAWIPLLLFSLLLLWILLGAVFDGVVDSSTLTSGAYFALPVAGLLCAIWVDANVTSLHGYYRRRLANAFAVRRTAQPRPGPGQPPHDEVEVLDQSTYYSFSDLRTENHGTTIPLSIATTANIRSYDEAPTRRGGIPFVFGPKFIELQLPDGSSHHLDSDKYADFAGRGRTTIMSAVAMSGAAVSPMAGRYSKAMSPFRLLLTVLNIRVGVWAPNPLWWTDRSAAIRATTITEYLTQWPTAPWLDSRPGIGQVLSEAAGRGSLLDRWIYLTDGGHLDNTGLVEAVRSLQTVPGESAVGATVIVLDASNDREGTWAAVGDALSVIASDLGIILTLEDQDQRAPTGESRSRGTMPGFGPSVTRPARWWQTSAPDLPPDFARIYVARDQDLRVLVVKAVRPTDLTAVELPEAVRSFALGHSDFPRAATTRQDFGDLEFEAYRQLGWWCTAQGLRLLDDAPSQGDVTQADSGPAPEEAHEGYPT